MQSETPLRQTRSSRRLRLFVKTPNVLRDRTSQGSTPPNNTLKTVFFPWGKHHHARSSLIISVTSSYPPYRLPIPTKRTQASPGALHLNIQDICNKKAQTVRHGWTRGTLFPVLYFLSSPLLKRRRHPQEKRNFNSAVSVQAMTVTPFYVKNILSMIAEVNQYGVRHGFQLSYYLLKNKIRIANGVVILIDDLLGFGKRRPERSHAR